MNAKQAKQVAALKAMALAKYEADGGTMAETYSDDDYATDIAEHGTAAKAWAAHMQAVDATRESQAVYDVEEVEAEVPVPAANPFAALAAPASAAAPAKVHALAVAGQTLVAANHVATFKGVRPVAQGGITYALTGTAYSPAPGHVNAAQWAAVQAAMAANGGQANVQQIAQAFAAAGLPAGLAASFAAYRAKGGKPNLYVVQPTA